ncbi:MAG: type III-B CRISPR module RAMP protein Cmr1, partial [Peptococcaceae bacterium]|nr:type III-B CRISPR module RAMP protein Cmr1 [Peptococcaceae bacterium]
MNMQITPLTPLWTGDAERKGERVLETGILGSLRWWYEALIRGLKYYVCDSGGGTCEYREKEKLASICPVCQLFGCTGYSRRFRLQVEGGSGAGPLLKVKLRNPGNNKHLGWRIPAIVADPFTLSFLPMGGSDMGDFEAAVLRCILHLIEQYGALGGKTSQGQGVVKIKWAGNQSTKMDFALLCEELARCPANQGKNLNRMPDLRNLVGATILLDDNTLNASSIWQAISLTAKKERELWTPPAESKWVPSSPAIRAFLRQWLRETSNFPGFNENLVHERHRLMGTTQQWGDPRPRENRDRPKGSDVFVTHFYKLEGRWTMRIFAFIPIDGNQVETAFRALLSDPFKLEKFMGQVVGGLRLH